MLALDTIGACWLFGGQQGVAISGLLSFRNAGAVPLIDAEVCAHCGEPEWYRNRLPTPLAPGAVTEPIQLTAVKKNPVSPVQVTIEARWRLVPGGEYQTASATVAVKAANGNQNFNYPVSAPLTKQNCKLVRA